MDWERFSFEYQLNVQDLFQNLVSIEAYKEASLNLVFPQEWQNQLDKLKQVRAVHGTTAIEGSPLSEYSAARAQAFPNHIPASSTVTVADLVLPGMLVEVEAIAVVGSGD